MEAFAEVSWESRDGFRSKLTVQLRLLEAAQVIASKYGFYDLDVDADDRGVKITATALARAVTARGKSLTLAVENLLEIIFNE